MRKSHSTCCGDATVFHPTLSHSVPHLAPVCGTEWPRTNVYAKRRRACELEAMEWGGIRTDRRTRASPCVEVREGCEAGYGGVIGRTLGEEEEEIGPDLQTLKEAVAASAFVGLARLPSNHRALFAVPRSGWAFDCRACLVPLCGGKVVSHFVCLQPSTLEKVDCDRPSSSLRCTLHVIYRSIIKKKSFSAPLPFRLAWNGIGRFPYRS